MPNVTVPLSITREQYLDWYRGAVQQVVARAADGRTVQFPCKVLQPFVTQDGIHGIFILVFDDEFKFESIHRLEPPSGSSGTETVA